jgi:methionyl-tRNA formyltransferase
MRILYFGTSPFAVPSLVKLLNSKHDVIGVVTQPDRPHGRRMSESFSPVKKAILEINPDLLLLQPEKARTKEFRLAVTDLAPDVLVVAAFGQILSQRLLDLPRFGGINVHGSLLPRWRGAAPMQYSMIAGDAETGVTIMQMAAGLDSGDILKQGAISLTDGDDIDSVEHRLSLLGADLLVDTLDDIEAGSIMAVPQDENLVTYAPPLLPDFGFVNWNLSAIEICNLVRGVTPRPGAFAFITGKRLKLWRCTPDPSIGEGEPGAIVELRKNGDLGILVQSGKSSRVLIKEVQPESKARMPALDFARGARLAAGSKFDTYDRTARTECEDR